MITRRAFLGSAVACGASGALAATGCGGELVAPSYARLDPALIERDPPALLPRGLLVFGYLDAQALFASSFGGEVAQVIQGLFPLGPESGFVVRRDVSKVWAGAYAMQGADWCAVVEGTFDQAAIQRAATARSITVLGSPLVPSQYAGVDLYSAGAIGFTVLTARVGLVGNETGMRRALDRLKGNAPVRMIPTWMTALSQTKGASMALAADVGMQPAVVAAAQKMAFLNELRAVRALGNVTPQTGTGVNLVGTFSYSDPRYAESGATAIQGLNRMAQLAALFTSFGGITVPNAEVARKDADVAFAMSLPDSLMKTLLRMGADSVRSSVSSTPVQGR